MEAPILFFCLGTGTWLAPLWRHSQLWILKLNGTHYSLKPGQAELLQTDFWPNWCHSWLSCTIEPNCKCYERQTLSLWGNHQCCVQDAPWLFFKTVRFFFSIFHLVWRKRHEGQTAQRLTLSRKRLYTYDEEENCTGAPRIKHYNIFEHLWPP